MRQLNLFAERKEVYIRKKDGVKFEVVSEFGDYYECKKIEPDLIDILVVGVTYYIPKAELEPERCTVSV